MNYTKEQKEKINSFKSNFRTYFEGIGCYDDLNYIAPIDPISISNFGITDLQFSFDNQNKLTVTIFAERAGLIVGKGGRTITGLKEYLGDVELILKDSQLWKFI